MKLIPVSLSCAPTTSLLLNVFILFVHLLFRFILLIPSLNLPFFFIFFISSSSSVFFSLSFYSSSPYLASHSLPPQVSSPTQLCSQESERGITVPGLVFTSLCWNIRGLNVSSGTNIEMCKETTNRYLGSRVQE